MSIFDEYGWGKKMPGYKVHSDIARKGFLGMNRTKNMIKARKGGNTARGRRRSRRLLKII